jgi:hypothetical protein
VTRVFTLGGAGVLGIGALLLAFAVGDAIGAIGGIGVLFGLAGLGGLVVASLLLGRADHKLARTTAGRVRDLGQRLDRLEAAVGALPAPATLEGRVDAARDDVIATLDARILGLHETVRELHRGGEA